MQVITVSSKGQIAIPKAIREALNLAAGSELTVALRGHEIILSKEPGWKSLRGMARGQDVTAALIEERQKDKQRENLRG
jgi:AbrB family looped-hinge helix DNA binding protein